MKKCISLRRGSGESRSSALERYLTAWQWWRWSRSSSWIRSWRWPSWPAEGPAGTPPSWSPAPSGHRRRWAPPGSSATPGLASGSLGLDEAERERWARWGVPSPWAEPAQMTDMEQFAQMSSSSSSFFLILSKHFGAFSHTCVQFHEHCMFTQSRNEQDKKTQTFLFYFQ